MSGIMMTPPKTAGIAPATRGALQKLQFNEVGASSSELVAAANEVATYHAPDALQIERHAQLTAALSRFLVSIAVYAPAGPERSTAISRAREAKMWASAAVALEGK